ncbi:uncharacterized protein LOC129588116 [Paramacrobiotus metropolitanus]|uniref:uncharacterized protein LOC129588116 n=1 Tax=Paramacrobiotus metropolitanus TaxID=2943436 RepID=UPI00244619CF|nr:uncharacterized protein LOC129588116 [Paramacrobiotus metropolitanus]
MPAQLLQPMILLAVLFVLLSECGARPHHSCRRLAGNMLRTRGCHVVHPRNNSLTIDCDGKNLNSVKNILQNFQNLGCNVPLKLHINKPTFPIAADLFNNVQKSLHRLEILHLTLHQSWDNIFSNLGSLKILVLHFEQTSRMDSIVLGTDSFNGLSELEYLRISTKTPVILRKDALKNLHKLKCLGLSGVASSCEGSDADFVKSIYPGSNSLKTHYEDPISHRVETCKVHTRCAVPKNA